MDEKTVNPDLNVARGCLNGVLITISFAAFGFGLWWLLNWLH